jgi:hypothetical protein
MITDCQGHCATAPPTLETHRRQHIESLKNVSGANYPQKRHCFDDAERYINAVTWLNEGQEEALREQDPQSLQPVEGK